MPSRIDVERRCYHADEIADMLGVARDWLYRKGNLEGLYRKGMPRPLTTGRLRIAKAPFDDWISKPLTVRLLAANDDRAPPTAPAVPASDAEHRAYLHAHYARGR